MDGTARAAAPVAVRRGRPARPAGPGSAVARVPGAGTVTAAARGPGAGAAARTRNAAAGGAVAASGGAVAAGPSYTISLTMAPATVRALAAGGARLCLMRAVLCDTADGVPLVWAATSAYGPATTLTWTEEANGYAATGQAPDGSPTGARDQRPVAPGRVLDVAENALTSIDPVPGDPRYVTVRSTASTPMACGLAQQAPLGPSGPAPYCAFPLHRGVFVFLAPLLRVALVFTALPLAAGTAVRHLPGPTVLADVGASGRVELAYDIDTGWSWQDANVTEVPLGGLMDALVVRSG